VSGESERQLRVVTQFPHAVRVVEHAWIPVRDDARLAAKLWIPEDAEDHPVPAILEYKPYRKNDFMAARDNSRHAWFAGHGYACCLVDLRGSGDSDGILEDEYLPLEQADGVEVIAWLAAQPFCSGAVGMIGISWGGFNGLQIAAHSPPALRAVVSVCSTDDRYADDVHYAGGALLGAEQLPWASFMLAINALPPDPAVVGEEWRRIWLERMDRTPPHVDAWVAHQRRDDYWKQGSVSEDYDAISCPVYMVGGWMDGYTNAVLRFLEGYRGPCKGLVGPWAHTWPNVGSPGPAIGFLQECLRFWDCHLKSVRNGVMEEPKLRVYLQDPVRPQAGSADRAGVWLAEPGWPSPGSGQLSLFPQGEGSLGPSPGARSDLAVPGTRTVGVDAGPWCPYGDPLDYPPDQREEDAGSLCFESGPLADDLAVLGFPRARLQLSAGQRYGQVAVRLCDIWPDGASTLITRGMLNLTHRDSHEHPEDLEPGRRYLVEVQLNAIGYRIPAGHRIRLAVSSGYWPIMWPAPGPAALVVHTGEQTALQLPVRAGLAGQDDPLPEHFLQPESAPYLAVETLPVPEPFPVRRVTRDAATRTVELVTSEGDQHSRLAGSGREYGEAGLISYRITEGDPLSAFVRCDRQMRIGRGDWQTRVETTGTMSATAGEFHITNVLDAYEGDHRVFCKTWHARIPRDHCLPGGRSRRSGLDHTLINRDSPGRCAGPWAATPVPPAIP
jgi:uncharacterized protein